MNGEAWIKEAYDAILANDFERALACFEQAIAGEPNHAPHYYKLSVTCARSGRLDRAMLAAGRAVELAPEDGSYRQHMDHVRALQHMERARILMERKEAGNPGENRKEALSLLREAVRLDPLSARAYLVMSAILEEAGERTAALQAVREALRLDPHRQEALALAARLAGNKPMLH